MRAPRVLLATTGSLGDLNPMRALGEELLHLGADVSFATYRCYERACKESGFRFYPLGNDEEYVSTLRYTRGVLEAQGIDAFVDRVNFDQLDLLYEQLLCAAEGADILAAPSHVIPAHLVAEKAAIPFVACCLCLIHLRSIAPMGSDEYRRHSTSSARWNSQLRKFRQGKNLERKVLPLASLISDATKVLGVLPSFLLSASDLRTPNLEVVGYAEHRQATLIVPDEEVRRFCRERTIAFSFGSFADACDPEYFLQESIAACRSIGFKCLYLSPHATANMLRQTTEYALVRNGLVPAAVFPMVDLAVHHGGTGTLMAACNSLAPMAIVPFFLDQPQQAARMEQLIGAPNISATRYDRTTAAGAFQCALESRVTMKWLSAY